MLEPGGRRVGVTLPEGQGQERIADANKVLAVGKPLELRPVQYSDEYGRVHLTLVYMTKDTPEDEIYFYPPTEEAVKGWRSATKRIRDQILAQIARENLEVPTEDTVDVVAQAVAEQPVPMVPQPPPAQVDITAGEQVPDEGGQASQ